MFPGVTEQLKELRFELQVAQSLRICSPFSPDSTPDEPLLPGVL